MNNQILEMAEKLKYISSCRDRLEVMIDGKSVEISKDEFTRFVRLELEAGKTLVSAIRDTVFKDIRRLIF